MMFRQVIFVQSGYEQAECERLFQGDAPDYMVGGYADEVIDYLKQWDMDEWCEEDIREEEPRTSPHCTRYAGSGDNEQYILCYDGSLGGIFMLYREANEVETAWAIENDVHYDALGFRK